MVKTSLRGALNSLRENASLMEASNRVDTDLQCDWCRKIDYCAEFQVEDDKDVLCIFHLCKSCLLSGAIAIEEAKVS